MRHTALVDDHDSFGPALGIHRLVVHIFALLLVIVYIKLLYTKYPLVGLDHIYFIPRLCDTHLFYRINGIATHWWTPTFGGGLPSFANPQQMQWSLPQLLLYILNPWHAVVVTTAGFMLIGYYATFHFSRECLRVSDGAAMIAALLFSTTGFFIQHISAGHLGYHGFCLLPVVVRGVYTESLLYAVLIIGVCIAYLFHSAGFYVFIIVVFSLMVSVCCIAILQCRFSLQFLLKPLIRGWCGLFAGYLLGFSKIVAVGHFMQVFPRNAYARYDVTLGSAFVGIGVQLWGMSGSLCRLLQEKCSAYLHRFTGAPYALWEIDIGLSPVFFLLSLTVLMMYLFQPGGGFFRHRWKNRWFWIWCVLLMFGMVVSVELVLARGHFYRFLKQVPSLASLHGNTRFAALFVFPLIVCFIEGWDWAMRQMKGRCRVFVNAGCGVLIVLIFSMYGGILERYGNLRFDVGPQIRLWKKINAQPRSFRVDSICALPDYEVLAIHASSLRPYEPLFGYNGERFATQLIPGSVRQTYNGCYNMTNPTGFLFSKESTVVPFERIQLSDREQFEEFISYGKPRWRLSRWQNVANVISALTAVIFSAAFCGTIMHSYTVTVRERVGSQKRKRRM